MTVIIAAIPRSGSSLIAGIFAAHGLWVGRFEKKDQVKTPTPYESFENTDIDNWFRHGIGPLQYVVDTILPEGKRLVYKCSPWKAQQAHKSLTDSCLVRCCRNFESIVKSSPDGQRQHRIEQLVTLFNMPGPFIDVDAVLARDFTTLACAFEHCGVRFIPAKAEAQIDDSLWHHR